MEKRYPFPFLDAYRREDIDFFFGRTEEIETIYKLSLQANIVLVYGTSGTGKTSLIQCGLASKFQSYDWLALNVRRGKNIISSLDKVLCDESDGEFVFEEKENPVLTDLARKMEAVYKASFKPLYLIFDQFEELYILGSRDEQQQFINTVGEILRVEQPVKIILSIREEYLGHLYEFERQVPELLRKKLRVEPMNLDKVKTVIQCVGSLPQSNVRLQAGEEEDIAEGVFKKIRGEEKTLHIPLPYLQVFLDKYYLHTTGDEDHQQEAILTLVTLEGMGDIGDVLRDFLDEQVLKIAQALQQKPETIWHILSPFVTLEGTKEPLSAEALYRSLPDADPALAGGVVQELVTRRILRFTEHDQLYEIAHDSLARQVHEKRSDEEIAILEVKRLIRSQVSLNPEAREFFTEKQLLFIEPYLTKFHPSDEEQDWVDRSWKDVKAQQEAEERRQREELERVQRQAEQERKLRGKAEEKEKQARQRTRLAAAVSIVALALALFAGWSFLQANAAREEADISAAEALRQKGEAEAAKMTADENFRKAKEEEAKTNAALEQVTNEQAATEEQRRKALQNLLVAQQKTKEAESERQKAVDALLEAKAKSILVVKSKLKDAHNDIFYLRYPDAIQKLNDAAAIGEEKTAVARILLEIAFFYQESERADTARIALDLAASLLGKNTGANLETMFALPELQGLRDSLRYRYYPTMILVEGGDAEIGDERIPAKVGTFKMAETETTMWQYALYCYAKGLSIDNFHSKPWGEMGGDDPVIYVSWYDAALYANWLSEKSGLKVTYDIATNGSDNQYEWSATVDTIAKGYRLPSEVEWEYAARGGKNREQFEYSGSDTLEVVGRYYNNSGGRTNKVKSLRPNSLGLYDMSGNVWEWCEDWYEDYPNPIELGYRGPKDGSSRVLRGGSWGYGAAYCRVAYRDSGNPDYRDYYNGIRLVFVP
jgi:formylglycine-generating enzyme required for sulfatase activity